MIPPYDDPQIIAGQGTVAVEICNQSKDIDAVIVPCGGGGLLAGIATYIKELHPEIEVICAEPVDSCCCRVAMDMFRSSDENDTHDFDR